MDADLSKTGLQDFTGLITGSFNAPGQLRFDAASNMLYGNVDADAEAEFAIRLEGVSSLSNDDFIF